jgi:hypothetical protein
VPHGRSAEVWGNARPAYFARIDTGQPQNVLVQFAPGTSGQFQTVATVPTSALGFIDTQVTFPSSGQVRLAWQYPAGDTALRDPLDPSPWITSRVTTITVYKYKASGYLRGLFTGHTKLGIKVKHGSGPLIRSLSVRAPRGLKFRCAKAKKSCKGLDIAGAKVKRGTVSHGTLVLTLASPASKVSITATAPFIHATTRNFKKKVTFIIGATDINGAPSTVKLKLKAK